jgi:hypothetical protein
MPATASARACSRRSPARSMRANGRAQSSVAPRALPLDRRASGSTPQGGLPEHGSATIGVVEWGADVLGASAESRQSGRDVAEQRDPKYPADQLWWPAGRTERAGEQALLDHPDDLLGDAGWPLATSLHGGEVALGQLAGGERAGTRPGIRPVMPRPRRSTGQDGAGFPLPFGCRPSLLEASCPARGFRPSYDRPAAPPAGGADPRGVSMFRTRETRLGPGALFTPGTAVPSRPANLPDRRTPPSSGRSLFTPVRQSAPGCNRDEASARVHWRSPLPAFPSPVIPGRYGDPRAFP